MFFFKHLMKKDKRGSIQTRSRVQLKSLKVCLTIGMKLWRDYIQSPKYSHNKLIQREDRHGCPLLHKNKSRKSLRPSFLIHDIQGWMKSNYKVKKHCQLLTIHYFYTIKKLS